MKLTKTKLKQVIKEEVCIILYEQVGLEKNLEFIAAQKRKAEEKKTFKSALTRFVNTLGHGTHEAAQGKWIDDLLKAGSDAYSKGDYAGALTTMASAAAEDKIPGYEILMAALKSIKDIEIQKPSFLRPRKSLISHSGRALSKWAKERDG